MYLYTCTKCTKMIIFEFYYILWNGRPVGMHEGCYYGKTNIIRNNKFFVVSSQAKSFLSARTIGLTIKSTVTLFISLMLFCPYGFYHSKIDIPSLTNSKFTYQ